MKVFNFLPKTRNDATVVTVIGRVFVLDVPKKVKLLEQSLAENNSFAKYAMLEGVSYTRSGTSVLPEIAHPPQIACAYSRILPNTLMEHFVVLQKDD